MGDRGKGIPTSHVYTRKSTRNKVTQNMEGEVEFQQKTRQAMGHTPASRQKNSIQSQSDDVWEEEKYDNVSNSEQGELVAGIDDGLYDNENKNNTCPDCKEVADDQDRPL